ncbi:glycoside hydrolase family 43 protein [Alkalicoccus daliensis]|uniref:Beta-xylosidase, GH43 family n=1 Tax=Alkalicoccus daliensis TaxID=745820 RepID=A0A1H0F4C5_9BACI|nr:glycoside hydrolase family 43 protein [Alkalicoccus daliensis]SDN89517.1 Beta-xylosidase, GH43 family [Alkalicoccus daliensis]
MSFQNPVISIPGVDHGDPAVIRYKGVYYLYHTGPDHVPVYTSINLTDWKLEGKALLASSETDHWAQLDLWAPEVFYENGTFYMYVTGAKRGENGTADDEERHIGVAKSKDPLGPFILAEEPLTPEWSIDAHPFTDDDGQMYMFYNVRNEHTRGPDGVIGTGNVVDKMRDPETLAGEPALVVKPEYSFEGNKEGSFFWNEGPFVLKRNNLYYQMYSAGFFGDDTYGVYYATSGTPHHIDGYNKQWEKFESGRPILQTNAACLGPGHHVVTKAPNGWDDYAVYHGYEPEEQVRERRVRIGKLWWEGSELRLEEPRKDILWSPPAPDVDLRSKTSFSADPFSSQAENFLFETTVQWKEDLVITFKELEVTAILDAVQQQCTFSSANGHRTVPFPRVWKPDHFHLITFILRHGELQIKMNQLMLLQEPVGNRSTTFAVKNTAEFYGTIYTLL